MKTKHQILLVLLVAIASASVYFVEENKKPSVNPKLLPSFHLEQINQTNKISIKDKVSEITLLKNDKGQWQVAERHNYPADVVRIRKLLVALSEARKIEQKVLRDEQYAELNLAMLKNDEDRISQIGIATQLDIFFNENSYKLLTGKDAPLFNNSQYIRLLDNDTTWLINRNLDLTTDQLSWLDKQIVHIDPADIHKMHIIRAGHEQIDIIRSDKGENLDWLGATDEQKIASESSIVGISTIPDFLEFNDTLMKDKGYKIPEQHIRIKYITFDGLEIDYIAYMKSVKDDNGNDKEEYYATFEVQINQDIASTKGKAKLQQRVTILSELYDKWYYTIKKSVHDTIVDNLAKLKLDKSNDSHSKQPTDKK